MLKKAKKSRRGGTALIAQQNPESAEVLSGPLGVPSTLGDPQHGKTTPDNNAGDSDEEGDAFL